MFDLVKRFVRAVSLDENNFLAFLTAVLLISIPITVYAALQSRDFRPRATHQGCFDLNGDFKVTQADADLILNYIGVYYAPYDINHDGAVNAIDAFYLLQHEGEICSPKITFSANPTTITRGSSSTLSWNVQYATFIEIKPAVGRVSSSGSRGVSPVSTTSYTLEAANLQAKEKKQVAVTVRSPTSPESPSTSPISPTDSENLTPVIQPDGSIKLVPKTLKKLKLKISAPYLIGKVKIPLVIGGRSKKIEISGGTKTYDFGVSKDKFKLGKKLTVVIGGDNTLKKKFKITPNREVATLKVGELIFGDLTGDNRINERDKTALLDAISNQTLVGDLNADGVTNSLDWAILLKRF